MIISFPLKAPGNPNFRGQVRNITALELKRYALEDLEDSLEAFRIATAEPLVLPRPSGSQSRLRKNGEIRSIYNAKAAAIPLIESRITELTPPEIVQEETTQTQPNNLDPKIILGLALAAVFL